MNKIKNTKGFTLMEMLIVVAIIAVLVAIAIPTFTKSLNDARVATDKANIRAGYASVMADILTNKFKAETNDTTAATATYFLKKDGSVTETATDGDYRTFGHNKVNDTEIAGIKITQGWEKDWKVSYKYTFLTGKIEIEVKAANAGG